MDVIQARRSSVGRLPKWAMRRIRGFARSLGLVDDPPAIPQERIVALTSPTMRDVAHAVNAAPADFPLHGVAGWLTRNEGRALYAIARTLDGPFLEIGSWVGRSTCHIASAIRDGGVPKQFVTTDLNPTTANFRPHGSEIGFFYPATSERLRGTGSVREYEAQVKPVITSPGGVVGTLSRNLERHKLREFVDIRPGHFSEVAPKLDYTFIFSDAMHDPNEIELNAPELRALLRPGSVLACHDTTRDPGNEAAIRRNFSIGESFIIDSLFVGQIT